jgi:hypothetical protein
VKRQNTSTRLNGVTANVAAISVIFSTNKENRINLRDVSSERSVEPGIYKQETSVLTFLLYSDYELEVNGFPCSLIKNRDSLYTRALREPNRYCLLHERVYV